MTPVEHLNTVINDMRSFKQTDCGREAERVYGTDTVDSVLLALLLHVCSECGFRPGAVSRRILTPRNSDEAGPLT